tara:strand:- start:261 stop:677 length:417 start_codon:yes stop_codon:yes gene_type:complete
MTQKNQYYKSFNIVYKREYADPEGNGEYFWISNTLYRNVPISKIKYYQKQLLKFKKIMDKNFVEDAKNFAGSTGIEIIYPDEYYQTYEDVFDDVAKGDKSLFNDFGQLFNTRQGFRKDFDPSLTKNYKTKREYIYNLN